MNKLVLIMIGLLGVISNSQATLTDLGGGIISDDVQNISWMQDANLFKTLCDAPDPIATGFVPVDAASAAAICTANGEMTWNDAELWIARLNAQNYLGFSDWRQPSTVQPDATCEGQIIGQMDPGGAPLPDQGFSYNCRGSELGHLFNALPPAGLGNPNDRGVGTIPSGGTTGTGCFPNCFTMPGSFVNTQSFAYWSGTSFAPDPSLAWGFGTNNGRQFADPKDHNHFVWPVRSGNAGSGNAAPIPTLSWWGLGLMGLLLGLLARRRLAQA